MASVLDCPDPGVYQELADETLSADDTEVLIRHLEQCPGCQARHDRAAGIAELWEGYVPHVGPLKAREDPMLARLLEELKGGLITERVSWAPAPTLADFDDHGDQAVPALLEMSGAMGRFGPYEVLEPLGGDELGRVFRGFDPRLNRAVVLKVLAPEYAGDEGARRRFLREAQEAAAISDEHVVAIHAIDAFEGVPYFVIEAVQGASLQETIDRREPLELDATLRIGLQVARGLAAIHAQGFVHRDLQPANVFLAENSTQIKITNVALAGDRTPGEAWFYLSPEQVRGEPADHRSDLYSLGGILYAARTGCAPREGTGADPDHRQVPAVSGELAALIARLRSEAPDDRYPSASEVVEVLQRHVEELPPPVPMPRGEQPVQPGTTTCRGGLGHAEETPSTSPRDRRHGPREDFARCLGMIAALGLSALGTFSEVTGMTHIIETLRPRGLLACSLADRGRILPGPPRTRTGSAQREVADLLSRPFIAHREADSLRAITAYTEAIRPDLNASAARRERAESFTAFNHWQRAIEDINVRIRQAPDDIQAYRFRGFCRMKLQEYPAAVADYTEALRQCPNEASLKIDRGWARLRAGDRLGALADFDEVILLDPNSIEAHRTRAIANFELSRIDRGFADLDFVARRAPNDSEDFVTRGNYLLFLKQFDDVVTNFDEAVRLGLDLARLRRNVIKALLWKRMSVRALRELDEAIRLDPKDAEFHHLRASAYLQIGDWEHALNSYDTSLRLNPKNPGGLRLRAIVLAVTRRYDRSAAEFDAILRTRPKSAKVLVRRARFLHTPRGGYDQAIADCTLALSIEPQLAEALMSRGEAHLRKGRFDEAIDDLDQAVVLKPEPPEPFIQEVIDPYPSAHLNRGDAYFAKGDLKRAVANYSEAIRLNPKLAAAYQRRAEALSRLEQAERPQGDHLDAKPTEHSADN